MSISQITIFLSLTLIVWFNHISLAQSYSLLNPTPDAKLRPMNTERSSKSDYVTTVDPGRVQLETSLVSVVKNKDCNQSDCTKTRTTTFGDTNMIRLGLTESSELQIVNNLYINKKIKSANGRDHQEGFGDTYLRFKYSFSGNNNEKFGIAATPFIKLPTNQNGLGNNDVEGGLAIPFAVNLNGSWIVGGMTQFNFLNDQNSVHNSYYTAYTNAVYLVKNFTNKLYGFAEYYNYKADTSNAHLQNYADFGLHYYITNNFKIDGGISLGLNQAADDLNYYTGFAYRF